MKNALALTAPVFILLPAIAVAAQHAVPAPPIPTRSNAVALDFPSGPRLLTWAVDAVRCDTGVPTFVRVPQPDLALQYGHPAPQSQVSFTFRVDEGGRALGITRVGTEFVPWSEDLAPALAAARFTGRRPQTGCTIRFLANAVPVAAAPREEAMRYSVFPNGTVPREIWERVPPAGSTCIRPAPAVLLRAFPDFKRVAGVPGQRQWSMVGFDLDRGGKPVRPHVIAGSEDEPLDRAAVAAVARSRWEAGAHTGCFYPYYRNAEVLAPPPSPDTQSLTPEGAACPRDLPYDRQPTLTFPDAYQRRSIEGWAVLAYDVAPWGEIGNVRVLAAEPAADFGEWGKHVIASATKPSGRTGYVGCVDKVVFRIGRSPGLTVSDTSQR